MFSTAKQVHIYIENQVQHLTFSNKKAISPYFTDMILNNAVLKYIKSKFPDKTSNADVETVLKRYTDFNRLKNTYTSRCGILHNMIRNCVYINIPSDCFKIQSLLYSYLCPIPTVTDSARKYTVVLTFKDDKVSVGNSTEYSYAYTLDGVPYSGTILTEDITNKVNTEQGSFNFYNIFVDRLRKISNFDIKFESSDINNFKSIYINLPLGCSDVSFTSSNNDDFKSVITYKDITVYEEDNTNKTSASLYSSIDNQIYLDDYYASKNLKYSTQAELSANKLLLYHTDSFVPNSASINYLKKPCLFNIDTGQIPEIDITDNFLDFAISEIMLALKDQAYTQVINKESKNF